MSSSAVTQSVSESVRRKYHIGKVAVLGAGTMGARIAAHLANAGVPSYLLDITPQTLDANSTQPKNAIAVAGLEGLKKSKPAAFFSNDAARYITIGNFDDDLAKIKDADWIIEVVAENLEIKRALLKRVEGLRKPAAIVTTNTSGLPIAQIAEGLSEDFRRHWFGTHFFNPPRYMRLLEIIATPESDPDAIAAISEFCDKRLGKAIVVAKDPPNFIANRIGTFSVLNVMRVMEEMDLSVEQVDALTGSAVGWPKSATFRTIDLVGLDILGHVVANMTKNVRDERSELKLPEFYGKMLANKWLGDKTRQGFYRKEKSADGEQRFALDWKTLEYKPQGKVRFAEIDAVKNAKTTGERLKMLLAGDSKSKVTQFYWTVLSDLWTYAANRIPEIAESVVEIDQAMKTGFNWELGPFELWDAVGVVETAAKMPAAPDNVNRLLDSGAKSWYTEMPGVQSGRAYFDLRTGKYQPVGAPEGVWSVREAKASHGVVAKNAGASLIDIGDGVGCIEIHGIKQAIGQDTVSFVTKTLKPGSEHVRNFDAFVITPAGANL